MATIYDHNRVSHVWEDVIENQCGGYNRYCAVWNTLEEIGVRLAVYSNGKAALYAMGEERSYLVIICKNEFFKCARTMDNDRFTAYVRAKFKARYRTLRESLITFPTRQLVTSSINHRILWASTVLMLRGFQDRLYDDCFEMGDGDSVANAVDYIRLNRYMTTIGECSIASVNAALQSNLCAA